MASDANTTLPVVCAQCGASKPGLQLCSGCHLVSYCDTTCQRQHRKLHKQLCRAKGTPPPATASSSTESIAEGALQRARKRDAAGDFRGALRHCREAVLAAPSSSIAISAVALARSLDVKGGSWVAADAPPQRLEAGRKVDTTPSCTIVVDSDVQPRDAEWAKAYESGGPFYFPLPFKGQAGGPDLRSIFGPEAAVGSMGELKVGILTNRIQLFSRGILGPEQHGARVTEEPYGASAVNEPPFVVMHVIRHLIEQSEMPGPAYLCFIRFESPYFNIHRKTLLEFLKMIGFPEETMREVRSLFDASRAALWVDGSLQMMPVSKGLPQDSPLAEVLMAMFLQTLINALNAVRLSGGRLPGIPYPASLVRLLNAGTGRSKLPPEPGHACVQAHGSDFVLLASSAEGLQALIHCVADFAAAWGLPLDCRSGETQVRKRRKDQCLHYVCRVLRASKYASHCDMRCDQFRFAWLPRAAPPRLLRISSSIFIASRLARVTPLQSVVITRVRQSLSPGLKVHCPSASLHRHREMLGANPTIRQQHLLHRINGMDVALIDVLVRLTPQ